MNSERLVAMANDIGNFFGGEPRPEDRVAGVLNHLKRFWDPRMRRQIRAYVETGGTGLSDHVCAAVIALDASNEE
ncbi:MAG: formate dehydrogenase subunit delta [Panacagrimonas sp.]